MGKERLDERDIVKDGIPVSDALASVRVRLDNTVRITITPYTRAAGSAGSRLRYEWCVILSLGLKAQDQDGHAQPRGWLCIGRLQRPTTVRCNHKSWLPMSSHSG